MRTRDTQKQKLYAAERTGLMGRWWNETPFAEKVPLWAFFDRLTTDVWFIRHYGRWVVSMGDGRGARIARGGWDGRDFLGRSIAYLKLPRWSRTRLVIIHELAHAVTLRKYCGQGTAWHGREYAAIYLDLVRHFLGADAEKALRAGYKAHGVKHRPKRVLTPERLEIMRERGRQLAASRR